MKNKWFYIPILVGLAVSGIVQLLAWINVEASMLTLAGQVGFAMAWIVAMSMMFETSTFVRSKLLYLAVAGLVFGLLGVVFKVMHWPLANQLLIFGFGAVAVTYLVWFIIKPSKGHLDVLKCLWVLSTYFFPIMVVLHRMEPEFVYVPHLLFWVLFVDFVYLKRKTQDVAA
jgi:hypothetical protein